jgi:hypothetical protein
LVSSLQLAGFVFSLQLAAFKSRQLQAESKSQLAAS